MLPAARNPPPAAATLRALAGLQSGLSGALWMLAWLGIAAMLRGRGFWAPENLMGTAFYRDAATQDGFAFASIAGLALYIVIYGLLGAVFAATVRRVPPGPRLLLSGILFALVWYYAAYHFLWIRWLPLVALLHPERPTVIAHVIYGFNLGRFNAYLPRPAAPAPAAEEVVAVEGPAAE